MNIYQVGGSIRDKLLGIPVKDIDWVITGATPEALIELGYKPVGKSFPVFLHPTTRDEYALARTERKTGHGYTGFACDFNPSVTLEEDLSRRDLTINAMAEDEEGKLHDPYQGQRDIERRLLRHVSPAFVEDPLRVLRVARFAARLAPFGFTVADETMSLMSEIVAQGEMQHLTVERVWQETERALGESTPMPYFSVLEACGALQVLLPEWCGEVDQADKGSKGGKGSSEQGANGAFFADEAMFQRLSSVMNVLQEPVLRWGALYFQWSQSKLQISPSTDVSSVTSTSIPVQKILKQLNQLHKRIKIPKNYTRLAKSVVLHAVKITQQMPLSAEQLMSYLEQEAAFRQPDAFGQLLTVCGAFKPDCQHLFDRYMLLLEACRQISAQALLDCGLSGPEVGAALRKARLQLLAEKLVAGTV